ASVVVVALAVINTLKGFDIVFMLTKGGPFHTSDNLAMFMYSETFFKYRVGYGAAIAVALFILAIIVIVIYFRQVRASERIYG
ncbi:MAG: sugar ABC transporter permease, partial [Chloroflexota bacterium]|nr:sugar ABC transporter permease [Chloroflexota bacterium]